MEKFNYNCPKGLMDGYEEIYLDKFCRYQCFKGFGGCPAVRERLVINIPGVIERIKKILDENPKAKIFFDAPNFIDIDWEKEIPGEKENQHIKILREIVKEKIKGYFRIETTPLSLNDKKPYFYSFLRKSGVKEIWLGVESGNRELRDKYRKPPFTNKQLKIIMERIKKAKILGCWYLVVGFLDSESTILETIDLINRLKPARIFLFQALPYEGAAEQFVDLERLKRKISDIERYRRHLQGIADSLDKKFCD